MIVLPILAGGTTLLAAGVLFRLWVSLPPRTVCPACRETTLTVGHPLAGGVQRWLKRRWCARCGWHGWGRNGPVLWRRRGPVAHGSGFRWGEDRLQADFGFRWADGAQGARDASVDDPTEEVAHPSGFRWAGDEAEDRPDSSAHHPSGFRFRETEAGLETDAENGIVAHPSGFRFRDDADGNPTDGSPADRSPPPDRRGPPSAFRWRSGPGQNGFRWKG